MRDNAVLARLLRKHPTARPAAAHAWLGAPNSIKGPTEAVFRRQSGSNLLIVGQREETALALLGVALVSLAAHYPAGAARFVVIEPTSAGSPAHDFLARIVAALPYDARLAAHCIPAEIDYPLCEPIPDTPAGVCYIRRYLTRLCLENELLIRFSPDRVLRLLTRSCPDYRNAPVNLYEPVAACVTGLALLGGGD